MLELGLKHVVITMVARDDLADQELRISPLLFAQSRNASMQTATIEVLTSDFSGNLAPLDIVLAEQPEIFNHNIETVRGLLPHAFVIKRI